MKSDIRERCHPSDVLIVAGDLNAKSPTWGAGNGDQRGVILECFAEALDLHPENVNSVPTFSVVGRSSVVDVTFARLLRGSSIGEWRVRADLFSDSDHRYIEYSLLLSTLPLQFTPNPVFLRHGWMGRKMDW